MRLLRFTSLVCLLPICVAAHPMGNFSVNHYTRIEVQASGPQLTYILDFAEIPTSELLTEWGIAAGPDLPSASLQKSVARQALSWAHQLSVTAGPVPLPVHWNSVQAATQDGAGGLPVLRVVMKSTLVMPPGYTSLAFRDGNYVDRTGWKEVVVVHGESVSLDNTTQSDRDLSHALTVYPADLTVTPPQDLSATVSWHLLSEPKPATAPLSLTRREKTPASPLAKPTPAAPQLAATATPQPTVPTFNQQQQAVAGTVQRGDYLSRMLQQKHFGWSAVLIGLCVAFSFGAMHALSPGHGKTIVAAYLVGSRGTLKHAGILGLTVTFTHTISVFLLGLGVLFFQKYIIPEKVVPVLGAISGLSIVVIGAYLLYQRALALLPPAAIANFRTTASVPAPAPPHAHAHSHSHAHAHAHSHAHAPASATPTSAFAHTHTHDGFTHTHAVPDAITMGSLLGLGISGGLVPCPSALILLLSAISLGQAALGLALLSAFSAGLAVVLIAIGALVLYGKSLLPKSTGAMKHPLVRLMPVFSAVVVIVLGLLMTLTAAGWLQPAKLFS